PAAELMTGINRASDDLTLRLCFFFIRFGPGRSVLIEQSKQACHGALLLDSEVAPLTSKLIEDSSLPGSGFASKSRRKDGVGLSPHLREEAAGHQPRCGSSKGRNKFRPTSEPNPTRTDFSPSQSRCSSEHRLLVSIDWRSLSGRVSPDLGASLA